MLFCVKNVFVHTLRDNEKLKANHIIYKKKS